MKEKNGTAIRWVIFSVIVVVVPVVVAFVISWIVNAKMPSLGEMLDSVILLVFSITCSLLSICFDVYSQKKEKSVLVIFCISAVLAFCAWTSYVFCLTVKLAGSIKWICFGCLLLTVFCSILGIFLGKRCDRNDNETISHMHDNCQEIRGKLLTCKCNKCLEPLTLHPYDLLCDPYDYDRVALAIKNYLQDGGNLNEKNE